MANLVAILALTVAGAAASVNPYHRALPPTTTTTTTARPTPDPTDPGDAVFVTPILDNGFIDIAQSRARVPPFTRGVESYAAYIVVDRVYNSSLFFWFFPAEQNPETAPVVLWLQGGPGASSLFGLFCENGPYELNNGTAEPRKYTWTKTHSVLYIDNPVGTGYSFTTSDAGYSKTEADVATNLLEALIQFFTMFPKLRQNEFYIAGESYAGKYIPALGYAIHNHNTNSNKDKLINLTGLFIGNGFTDPENMMVYSDYLYQLGLVDDNGRQQIKEYEDRIVGLIRQEKWTEAFEEQDKLMGGDLIPYPTLFKNLTGFDYYFNYQDTWDNDSCDAAYQTFVQDYRIRRALHVGNRTWNQGPEVEEHLQDDVMKSVAPWLATLLDHYRVLVYNGQLDIIVAYPLSDNYLRKLSWSGAHDFEKAERKKWMVGDQLAGYAKTAGRLTQVLVRDAGHMVPADQPLWALDLLHRFTSNKSF